MRSKLMRPRKHSGRRLVVVLWFSAPVAHAVLQPMLLRGFWSRLDTRGMSYEQNPLPGENGRVMSGRGHKKATTFPNNMNTSRTCWGEVSGSFACPADLKPAFGFLIGSSAPQGMPISRSRSEGRNWDLTAQTNTAGCLKFPSSKGSTNPSVK